MLLMAIISLATYSISTSSPVIINFSVFCCSGSGFGGGAGAVLYKEDFLEGTFDTVFFETSGSLGVIVALVDA